MRFRPSLELRSSRRGALALGRWVGALWMLAAATGAARGEEPPPPEAIQAAAGRVAEEDLLRRWADSGPEERRRLERRLDAIERARRFVDAGDVLVAFEGKRVPVRELYVGLLETALRASPASQGDGLAPPYRKAVSVLRALTAAYAPPQPASAGTINLFLQYAADVLAAEDPPPSARLRLLVEALRAVRSLDGRAKADSFSRWLVAERIGPAFLAQEPALAGHSDTDLAAEAARLLATPALAGERLLARLAPYAAGTRSLEVLLRAYHQGLLGGEERPALVASVVAEAGDDPLFAASAPPLFLELLADPAVPAPERGDLADVVAKRFAGRGPLEAVARDLFAAAFGGALKSLADYEKERKSRAGPLPHPESKRRVRFLRVLLEKSGGGAPPAVTEVDRRDETLYRSLRRKASNGTWEFLGVLLPAASPGDVDFLGPPPAAPGGPPDPRLLRRTLHRECVAVATHGASSERLEICAALPDDASEPVPRERAVLGDVVAFLRHRLEAKPTPRERAEIVKALCWLDTRECRGLAVAAAETPQSLAALLPLAEEGDRDAAEKLLDRIGELSSPFRERVLQTVLSRDGAQLGGKVRALCGKEALDVAGPAAARLLDSGDASGVLALLRRPGLYARACGAALALRLGPLAGSLRVIPQGKPGLAEIETAAAAAFGKKDPPAFQSLGAFVQTALKDPAKIRRLREQHKQLYVGRDAVAPSRFAAAYEAALTAHKVPDALAEKLVAFLLAPEDPGRGIPSAALGELLDALEARAKSDEGLLAVWREWLLALACVAQGVESDDTIIPLVNGRLRRLAGDAAPPDADRAPGVAWTAWAAARAAK